MKLKQHPISIDRALGLDTMNLDVVRIRSTVQFALVCTALVPLIEGLVLSRDATGRFDALVRIVGAGVLADGARRLPVAVGSMMPRGEVTLFAAPGAALRVDPLGSVATPRLWPSSS